jgi:hypothetical protein
MIRGMILSLIPGIGLFRRSVTLVLCAGAFWAGVKFNQLNQVTACRDIGGSWNPLGFCSGDAP